MSPRPGVDVHHVVMVLLIVLSLVALIVIGFVPLSSASRNVLVGLVILFVVGFGFFDGRYRS